MTQNKIEKIKQKCYVCFKFKIVHNSKGYFKFLIKKINKKKSNLYIFLVFVSILNNKKVYKTLLKQLAKSKKYRNSQNK